MSETFERFIRLVIRLIIVYFVIVVVGGIILSSLHMSEFGFIFPFLCIAFIVYALSSLLKKK